MELVATKDNAHSLNLVELIPQSMHISCNKNDCLRQGLFLKKGIIKHLYFSKMEHHTIPARALKTFQTKKDCIFYLGLQSLLTSTSLKTYGPQYCRGLIRTFNSFEEFKTGLQEVLEAVILEEIRILFNSVDTKLTDAMQAKGGNIKY